MPSNFSVDHNTLEWAGRLCALLLNDGTDVMRWFLIDHLPRNKGKEPNLSDLLKANREVFISLRDQEDPEINHEMFDILFGADEEELNMADLEISLLFVLIRHLCRLKHPSWKLWNQEPTSNQITPLFDVIRLTKFKQRMHGIVHKYKITEESFKRSWIYITSVLDRLKSYKISSRRWQADVMKDFLAGDVKNIYIRLTEVMRWQTLDLSERNKIYLNLKESRNLDLKENPQSAQIWDKFIAQFGQKRAWRLSCLDKPKPDKEDDMTEHEITLSPACKLNQRKVREQGIVNIICHNKATSKLETNFELFTPEEIEIMNSITDEVFVEGSCNHKEDSRLMRNLRDHYITHYGSIIPLSSEPNFRLRMDDVVCHVETLENFSERTKFFAVDDVPLLKPVALEQVSWRKILSHSKPLRLMINGPWSVGKTTLLHKMAYDWATNNCLELQDYGYVFYIDCSLVMCKEPYTSLSECIIDQSLNEFPLDEVENLFDPGRGLQSYILILIDGIERLPELTSDAMSEIKDVICGHRWPNCSVVVTTASVLPEMNTVPTLSKSNSNTMVALSQTPGKWKHAIVTGFDVNDVIASSRLWCKFTDRGGSQTDSFQNSHQLLQATRVFQRDVYKGVMSSPIMIYLLCAVWKFLKKFDFDFDFKSKSAGPNILPETLSGIVKSYAEHHDVDSSFGFFARHHGDKALQRTLRGDSGNVYSFATEVVTKQFPHWLFRHVKSTKNEEIFKFSHVLFEQYQAAWHVCSAPFSFTHWEKLMREYIKSLRCAISLRYFILFCCCLKAETADIIIRHLTYLLRSSSQETCHNTSFERLAEEESVKHLNLQIFYEMNSDSPHSFLYASKVADKLAGYRDDGSVLCLREMKSASNRTKQGLFFITAQCKPKLTRSGTVFPYLDKSPTWIHTLCLFHLRGNQLHFIATLLQNLPFLEVAQFQDVQDVSNTHIDDLSRGLIPKKGFTSALHKLIFTEESRSFLQVTRVTTYASLGLAIKHLPYLEELDVTITSPSLLFSLFSDSTVPYVIPLQVIDLSKTGLSSSDCCRLAELLKRLVFVRHINLSQNPLGDKFQIFCQEIGQLLRLETLNISHACLTSSGIHQLAHKLSMPTISNSIRYLNLNGNQIQDQETLAKLAAALKDLVVLEYLNLNNNFLGDSGMCILAKTLEGHKNIRTLYLDYTQITMVGFAAIRQHLCNCRRLKDLSLAGNYSESKILDVFSTSVKSSGTTKSLGFDSLEELDLSGISDDFPVAASRDSLASFAKFIQHHTLMKRLILRHFQIRRTDLMHFLDICQNYSSLHTVELSRGLISLDESQKQSWACLVTTPFQKLDQI
ncbi:uncharacterized protein LOC143466129 [Clavelina lepadiformis]|uniref:uncharacterized protein LOC143466129 n=1 Tax=Clavelina lepadiformis TaxID=159417 RepID=UPI00404208C1